MTPGAIITMGWDKIVKDGPSEAWTAGLTSVPWAEQHRTRRGSSYAHNPRASYMRSREMTVPYIAPSYFFSHSPQPGTARLTRACFHSSKQSSTATTRM